jgi:hypothetical protein
MREIKFRARKDDISNLSFQHGQLTFDTNGCPRIHFADGMSTSCLKGTEGQFTGLTDRNGKEIYEGDIIAGQLYKAYEVKWDHDSLGWNIGLVVQDLYQVIGNIHENPELLNK